MVWWSSCAYVWPEKNGCVAYLPSGISLFSFSVHWKLVYILKRPHVSSYLSLVNFVLLVLSHLMINSISTKWDDVKTRLRRLLDIGKKTTNKSDSFYIFLLLVDTATDLEWCKFVSGLTNVWYWFQPFKDSTKLN